jgi:hypothetical protein
MSSKLSFPLTTRSVGGDATTALNETTLYVASESDTSLPSDKVRGKSAAIGVKVRSWSETVCNSYYPLWPWEGALPSMGSFRQKLFSLYADIGGVRTAGASVWQP